MMSMIEVRLFELQCKGDRLDEINAEESLARHAVGGSRLQALIGFIHCTGHQIKIWVGKQSQIDHVKAQSIL